MQELNLPPYPFKLKRTGAVTQIYDVFRRKWVVVTPEEWVRQHMAMHLTGLGYVKERLSIEHTLKINGMSRRADIVFFSAEGHPILLVECKAPDVMLNQKTMDQAARYNTALGVVCVIVTNGLEHFCLIRDADQSWKYANALPEFSALLKRSEH